MKSNKYAIGLEEESLVERTFNKNHTIQKVFFKLKDSTCVEDSEEMVSNVTVN